MVLMSCNDDPGGGEAKNRAACWYCCSTVGGRVGGAGTSPNKRGGLNGSASAFKREGANVAAVAFNEETDDVAGAVVGAVGAAGAAGVEAGFGLGLVGLVGLVEWLVGWRETGVVSGLPNAPVEPMVLYPWL